MAMDTDYVTFRRLLGKALNEILWLYFKTPVAGQEEEIFRERIFCYELYHQLRCAFDAESFGYWIGGELDKDRHPIIRGDLKPDLVVHEPGDMDHNLCVLEVKPITGADAGFKKDVATLTRFVTEFSYHSGILLVFGDGEAAESVIKAKIGADLGVLREKHVCVLWAKNAQCRLAEL
jgi:hypothetical protein